MDWRKNVLRTGALVLVVVLAGLQAVAQEEIPVTTKSEVARLLYLEAFDRLTNGEPLKAAPLVDQAILEDADFALAYALRAQIDEKPDLAQKDWEKARSLVDRVSRGEGLLITYYEAQAGGQTAKAKETLEAMLAAFPHDKKVQFTAGAHYYLLGDQKNSLPYLQEAVKLAPKFAAPYNLIGYSYMQLGDMDNAEKAFKRYIGAAPTYPNPYDSYAEFLRVSHRYDQSIKQYQRALAIDSTFSGSMLGIGDCYLKMGNTRKALEQYQAAVDKSPLASAKLACCYKHAAAHVAQGSIAEALGALEERKEFALKENQNASAVMSLAGEGYILSALGKPLEGVKKYDEALELARTLPLTDAQRDNFLFTANFWHAYANIEARNMEKADEYLNAFRKDVERRHDAGGENALKSLQGYYSVKQGRYDEGIQTLSAIPETPFTLFALAAAYTKKGDKEQTAGALDKLNKWQSIDLPWAISVRQASLLRGI